MNCPRCQRDNRPGWRFCSECGAALASSCPACGFSNEPAENFCGGCGRPLPSHPRGAVSPGAYTPLHLAERILVSRHALEGERKQVTVLFADLKSSLELIAEQDPEEARRTLDAVVERMIEAVHRYEGTVNQIMGDGIMALFGAPISHEDQLQASLERARLGQGQVVAVLGEPGVGKSRLVWEFVRPPELASAGRGNESAEPGLAPVTTPATGPGDPLDHQRDSSPEPANLPFRSIQHVTSPIGSTQLGHDLIDQSVPFRMEVRVPLVAHVTS